MTEQIPQAVANAIRPLPPTHVTEELRAALDVLARLHGQSVSSEIRDALVHWLDRALQDPETQQLASAAREEIDREARLKSDALSSLFADGAQSQAD